MPVYLKPDERMPEDPRPEDPSRDQMDLIEGFLAGCRSSLACMVVGAILLPLMLLALRPALLASDKLFVLDSDHWSESYMPTVLFAVFGAGFGVLLGWRLSASASLSGGATWLITGVAVAALIVVGVCSASLIFAGGIPTMCWIGLCALGLATACAIYLFSLWTG